MAIEFYAEPNPSNELCKKIAALTPSNPFYTSCYVDFRRLMGFQPWILSLRQKDHLISACTAFLRSHYFNRSLEIHSLCYIPDGDTFYEGLLHFCRKNGISNLSVNTFASGSSNITFTIPSLPGEIGRRARSEYVLSLTNSGLWDKLSSNHRRNIKRGLKAALRMRCFTTEQACEEHARLGRASMLRRNARGESVPLNIQAERFLAMIRSGAGKLFQAVLNGEVLSSVLVLTANKGAYYQSAGTSPEGMKTGASQFLIYNIAEALQKESMELFNLGGADGSNPGLQRFKAGFGANEVKLEAAQFYLGSKFKKQILETARKLRSLSRLYWL